METVRKQQSGILKILFLFGEDFLKLLLFLPPTHFASPHFVSQNECLIEAEKPLK